jgi:hypothetical protein
MEQKLEIINNWNLKKLLTELETGNIKIPRFQRDYIWEKGKVVKLLNSIYNQYPIGSFFFWKAPADYSAFIRPIEIEGIQSKEPNGSFRFILDGQQRILSLYLALRGKTYDGNDYSSICFNPEKQEFLIPRSQREKFNIPAWKLLNHEAYGEMYAELLMDPSKTRKRKNQLAETWRECQEVFSNYPISIVKSTNEEIDDVVEIFERINQGGKHLTIFDLIHATTWSEKFDLKQCIEEFNTPQRVKSFGELSEKVFTLSLTLNAFDDARNFYQLKLTPEICAKIWPKTKTSLIATLDFMKQMRIAGDVTAYHNLIPVLQYYFYKTHLKEIDPHHQKSLEKWFWDAKFSKRYSTSVATRIKEDVQWISGLIDGVH